MISEIKVINVLAIGNRITVKYRIKEDISSYIEKDKFDVKIMYNENIIISKNIKKMGKNVVQVNYKFDELKNLIKAFTNTEIDLLVVCNSENKTFKINSIDENQVYTNIFKRIFYSKKFTDMIEKIEKVFLGSQDYKFNKKLKYDKNFRRDVIYAKAYEEEKIDDKIIFYESFHGKTMSDNPYAIFKHLLNNEEYKEYKHVWALNDFNVCKEIYRNMVNVEFVKVNSDKYIKYLSTAKYLINNTTFPPYFIRKEAQIYLNTWHGTPMKTLGKFMKGTKGQHRNIQRNLLQTTHLINPNKFTSDIMLESHDIKGIYNGKIFDCGYPRIDLTLNSNREVLKNKLNLNKEKKIILYAPTWRGEVGCVDNEIQKFINDYEVLLKEVGEEYTILLRVHTLMMKSIKEKGYGDCIVDERIDTNELLSAVDILISDYSSIVFDFIPTKNPILLYCYDEEKYANERGFTIDLGDIPARICYTLNDLIDGLNNHKNIIVENKEKYDTAHRKYNYNDDGRATERVVDFVFNNRGDDVYTVTDNKKNILMYCGGFLNNGITTSAINLLDNIDYDKYNVYIVDKGDYNDESEFNISQVNKNVKIIYRSGNLFYLKEEMKAESEIFMNGLSKNINEEKEISCLYKREFRRLFSNSKFDIVIDFSGYVKYWTLLFATSDINKKIIYQHNEMIEEYNKIINGKLKHKKNLDVIFPLYNNFDKVVSVAKHTMEVNKQSIRPWVKEVERRFDYIHNSINYKKVFERSSQRNITKIGELDYQIKDYKTDYSGNILIEAFPKINSSNINFVNIGRLSPEKDQIKLINAFYKVVEKYPNSRLYILGDGVLRKEIDKLIIGLGLQNHIILTGQVKNPFEIVRDCDCFVLSSNHEGQPMVLLEMLILNKDIIATDIPGNRSVLEGGYGLLCDNNEEALAQSMIDYISKNNKQEYKQFDYKKYNEEAMSMFYKVINS